MLRCDASGELLPPKSLNEGDSVEMLTGPFANFIATVDTIDPEQRIWVLMDFMGQKHVCRSVLINCNSLNNLFPKFPSLFNLLRSFRSSKYTSDHTLFM